MNIIHFVVDGLKKLLFSVVTWQSMMEVILDFYGNQDRNEVQLKMVSSILIWYDKLVYTTNNWLPHVLFVFYKKAWIENPFHTNRNALLVYAFEHNDVLDCSKVKISSQNNKFANFKNCNSLSIVPFYQSTNKRF